MFNWFKKKELKVTIYDNMIVCPDNVVIEDHRTTTAEWLGEMRIGNNDVVLFGFDTGSESPLTELELKHANEKIKIALEENKFGLIDLKYIKRIVVLKKSKK